MRPIPIEDWFNLPLQLFRCYSSCVWNMKKIPCCLCLLLYCLPVLNTHALENVQSCADSQVVVHYVNVNELQMACKTVSEVVALADKIGLKQELNITIAFVDALNINASGKALATFKPETMTIQVLTLEMDRQQFAQDEILNRKIDLELYKSILVHELAHAILWVNKGNQSIARELHEYFAYIIQFTLLPESYRNAIVTASDVRGFSSRDEITIEYYLLNPTRFAVNSYLHFLKNNEGWAYLKMMLKQ